MNTMQVKSETVRHGYVLLPGEGQLIEVAGETITFKAISENTDGEWALIEFVVPPHFPGPPSHWHQNETEGFYVLAGTLTLQIEDKITQAPAGSFALIPPTVVHTFSNKTDRPVTFLSIMSPGGFEGFIKELAAMMQKETAWPPKDMTQYKALNAKYGMYNPSTP